MKVYLSGLEASGEFDYINSRIEKYLYMLVSYYYIKDDRFKSILNKSEKVLVDSGAHSFQKGKKVDWLKYTQEYAEFIKKNDCDKIVGYFEMDVDNIIGYENVLKLRKILESVSNKIIPVWHKNRGIPDFIEMCKKYRGKWIAITGFKNEDIKDEQYGMFLRTAWKYGCKVHCLGMTRRAVINKIPFNSVDSSSWKQSAIYGNIRKDGVTQKVSKRYSKENRPGVMLEALKNAIIEQKTYYNKWKKYE